MCSTTRTLRKALSLHPPQAAENDSRPRATESVGAGGRSFGHLDFVENCGRDGFRFSFVQMLKPRRLKERFAL